MKSPVAKLAERSTIGIMVYWYIRERTVLVPVCRDWCILGLRVWIIRGLHFHMIYCMNIFNEKERMLLISNYYAILMGINDILLNGVLFGITFM